MTQRIHASYWLETGADPARAADIVAGEQSSGTFLKLANEAAALKERAGTRVERLEVLETVGSPSLPGGLHSDTFTGLGSADLICTAGGGIFRPLTLTGTDPLFAHGIDPLN